MRLLITGGAGFLGSHFLRAWSARHPADELVNLDALSYAGSLERLADLPASARYRFVQGDVCDAPIVRQAMAGCELIVHFAAETHVDRSITNAAPFLRTNIEGTYTLLSCAREAGAPRVIHISTDEVYGPVLEGAANERAPLSPRSPYAASKAAADLLVQACAHTHGLAAIIVRPTNIFGPWQLPEKFIPLGITNALQNRSLPLYGDGAQRRAWLFVDDFCEALQVVVERGSAGAIYNLGSGTEQANVETARQLLRQVGRSEALIQFVADRPGHDRRYAMDDATLRALGWRPRTRFEDGLGATIAWYRAHASWWRPLVERLREDPYHWLNRTAGRGVAPQALGLGAS